MAKPSKTDLKEQFIELRASGFSYVDIAKQLGVSKPTLITWAKDLQTKLQNARTMRMDELFEQFLVAKAKRVEVFGKRLERILLELDNRDLTAVPTGALLKLALDYGDRLKAEAEPLTLRGDDVLDMPSLTTPEIWPA